MIEIQSTNPLERITLQVKHRTDVVYGGGQRRQHRSSTRELSWSR
ncbi:hypothetical protein [Streptomyces inusitatus]|nr:hypothetical protein [Streptomyces inusitatus]